MLIFKKHYIRMKIIVIIISFVLLNISVHCQPAIDWLNSVGGVDVDLGYSIATDNNGNVYVVGRFKEIMSFQSNNKDANLTLT